jgi:hypothetical protein
MRLTCLGLATLIAGGYTAAHEIRREHQLDKYASQWASINRSNQIPVRAFHLAGDTGTFPGFARRGGASSWHVRGELTRRTNPGDGSNRRQQLRKTALVRNFPR